MADSRTSLVAVRDARERAIARLSDAFAHDDLDLEEFERRLTVAHQASSLAVIEELISDLAVEPSSGSAIALAKVAPTALVQRDSQKMMAVLGGVMRRGAWTPARQTKILAVMGGGVLDFREANLAPGVTEIHVTACMGGVQIIVPPNLAVEMNGGGPSVAHFAAVKLSRRYTKPRTRFGSCCAKESADTRRDRRCCCS